VRNVTRMSEGRGVYRILVGKPERKRPLGDPGLDGRITLECIFRKLDVGLYELDRAGPGLGQVAGNCECSNKRSGFIKYVEFLD
jgi:hypothetical protein